MTQDLLEELKGIFEYIKAYLIFKDIKIFFD